MITLNGNEVYTAGSSIADGFRDAVQIARKTGQVVRLQWNGGVTPITYSDTPEGLMSQWSRKHSTSKSSRQNRKERNERTAKLFKQARRAAATLPGYLFAWALDSDRFYGKALSILMAADALQIAKQYKTADAIKDAFNNGQIVTVADSGASHAMTTQMAAQIAEGKFPGQDSAGLITHHYRDGKETFNLWKEVNGNSK